MLRLGGLVLVWSVLLAALSAFGINVTALVAGLVGGIALARRAAGPRRHPGVDRDTVVDKTLRARQRHRHRRPVGDRATRRHPQHRARQPGGEELVIANNDMLAKQIQN